MTMRKKIAAALLGLIMGLAGASAPALADPGGDELSPPPAESCPVNEDVPQEDFDCGGVIILSVEELDTRHDRF